MQTSEDDKQAPRTTHRNSSGYFTAPPPLIHVAASRRVTRPVVPLTNAEERKNARAFGAYVNSRNRADKAEKSGFSFRSFVRSSCKFPARHVTPGLRLSCAPSPFFPCVQLIFPPYQRGSSSSCRAGNLHEDRTKERKEKQGQLNGPHGFDEHCS
jgi:hypothetical protein